MSFVSEWTTVLDFLTDENFHMNNFQLENTKGLKVKPKGAHLAQNKS